MMSARKHFTSSHGKSNALVASIVTIAVAVAVVLGLRLGNASNGHAHVGPRCEASSLTLTATGEVGLGNASYVIVFHNTSSKGCTLVGYPTVVAALKSKPAIVSPGAAPWLQLFAIARQSIEGQSGGIVGSIKQMMHYSLPTVLLAARTGVASIAVEWNEEQPNPSVTCQTFAKLQITLPEENKSMTLDARGLLCSEMYVHPVVPGTTGKLILK